MQQNEPSPTSMRQMVLEIFHFKVRNLGKMDIAILLVFNLIFTYLLIQRAGILHKLGCPKSSDLTTRLYSTASTSQKEFSVLKIKFCLDLRRLKWRPVDLTCNACSYIAVPDQIGTLSQVGTKKISKGGWTI